MGSIEAVSKRTDNEDLYFLREVRRFVDLLKSKNFKIRDITETSIEHFLSLPEPIRRKIAKQFLAYSNIIFSASLDGIDIRNDVELLKYTKKSLGIIISDEVYDTIKTGEIIEIYNSDFVQVYRNLALFDICGYGILDLLAYEFYELYERSESVNEKIFILGQELMKRPFDLSPVSLNNIKPHLMREKFSIEKVTSTVEFRTSFPVYTWPNIFYGVFITQMATPILEVPENVSFL